VGLQLKPILQRLARQELIRYASVAAAVCLAAILIRILWVMGYAAVARWDARRRANQSREPAKYPSFRIASVIAWCGMRGIVTLAAALALPDGVHGPFAFPYRDLILFTAFCVVLGTLVIQGVTVSPLMRALAIRGDGSVEREVRLARAETARAALDALQQPDGHAEPAQLLRRRYEERLERAERGATQPQDAARDGGSGLAQVQRRAQAAERRTLSELRATGVIGDDAFHRVEEELDWAEVDAEGMAREE
ncbi:MAG: cation:proton antiporter, partial [Gemmatimonadales bacterium]